MLRLLSRTSIFTLATTTTTLTTVTTTTSTSATSKARELDERSVPFVLQQRRRHRQRVRRRAHRRRQRLRPLELLRQPLPKRPQRRPLQPALHRQRALRLLQQRIPRVRLLSRIIDVLLSFLSFFLATTTTTATETSEYQANHSESLFHGVYRSNQLINTSWSFFFLPSIFSNNNSNDSDE